MMEGESVPDITLTARKVGTDGDWRSESKMIIVGAGIGGLTAAIAIRQSGFPVTVLEQAPELSEVSNFS